MLTHIGVGRYKKRARQHLRSFLFAQKNKVTEYCRWIDHTQQARHQQPKEK